MVEIDWERFKQLTEKLIKYRMQTTRVHVNAESWEEVIYAILLYMEYEVGWELGSHRKGVDIEVKLNGNTIGISAKGGKINAKSKELTISSYRLTRYRNIEKMLAFLSKNASEIDFYLICAREEKKESIKYHIFKIDSHALVPEKMLDAKNWQENSQAWELKQGAIEKLKARIVKKMSCQLWYHISLTCDSLKLLAKVEMPKSEIGLKLNEVLKSLDR